MKTKRVRKVHYTQECVEKKPGLCDRLKGLCDPCYDPCPTYEMECKKHCTWETECYPVTKCKKVKVCTPVCKQVCSYECVTECIQVPCTTTKCVPECKTETYTVCVPKCTPVTCTRKVCTTVPCTETVMVCKMVPKCVEKQVPISTGCDTGCDTGCGEPMCCETASTCCEAKMSLCDRIKGLFNRGARTAARPAKPRRAATKLTPTAGHLTG